MKVKSVGKKKREIKEVYFTDGDFHKTKFSS